MKKTIALATVLSLLVLFSVETAAGHVVRPAQILKLSAIGRIHAPPQSANFPRWQSREEHDAFNAMVTVTEPDKKIALAEAFLQKYPTSDFKSGAYATEMNVYYSQGKSDKAIDAAREALRFDRDNLDALTFLSYVFPFTFKPNDPDKDAKLASADADAYLALDVLSKLQKPAKVKDEDFNQYVRGKGAILNSTIGFVSLQRKNYTNAITALHAAMADNHRDVQTFYRTGVAYIFSTPSDLDHGIWYLARAAGLARETGNPSYKAISRYLRRVFVETLGSDAAMEETITQALAHVNPPGGLIRPVAPRGGISPVQNGFASPSIRPYPSASGTTAQTGPSAFTGGYPPIYPTWLPPPENGSGNQALPLPPAALDDQMAGQFYNSAADMSLPGQDQPWQYAYAPAPPEPAEPPEPEPAPPAIVLVYKDGRQVEVQNYAIVGQNLVWFSGQLSKKIPLADLDLPATRKVNEDHGTAFGAPGTP